MRDHRRRLEELEGVAYEPVRLEVVAADMARDLVTALAAMAVADGVACKIGDVGAYEPRIRENLRKALNGEMGDSATRMARARLAKAAQPNG